MISVSRRSGFALAELLVAIFVLALAVAGAVAVIVTAGRSANGARDRLLAEELARTALADALHSADLYRSDNGGVLDMSCIAGVIYQAEDTYFLGCYERKDPRTAPSVGWVWRAHSFSPAIGAYSLDVWVYRNPAELPVNWGRAPNPEVRRQHTLLYLQSKLETRKP